MSDPLRVLHLVDPGSPGGDAYALRMAADAVTRIRSFHQDVLLLGTADQLALARRCGLHPVGSFCPSRLPHSAGRRALARWLNHTESQLGSYDIIHAWTPRTAILATLAAPHRTRVGWFNVGPVSGFQAHFLHTLLDHHPMTLQFSSTAVQREYEALGIPRTWSSTLAPGIDPNALTDERAPDRDCVRSRWRHQAPWLANDRFVIGILSEPVSWADAMNAVTVALRLRLSNRPVTMLVHPLAFRRARAERFARDFNSSDVLLADHAIAEPWRILRGLDAVMHVGSALNSADLSLIGSPFAALTGGGRHLRPMPPVSPLLWSMAASLPIVAEHSEAVTELIKEGHNGVLVPQHDVNAMTDRLAGLFDDRPLASRLGHAARESVVDRFHIKDWCVGLKQAWTKAIAGQAVCIVEATAEPAVSSLEAATGLWTGT